MTANPFTLGQNIFKASHSPIHVISCSENDLNPKILGAFIDTATGGVIGVAPAYGSKSALAVIAFSTLSQVLLVRLSSSKPNKKSKNRRKGNELSQGRILLRDIILCHPQYRKLAFRMDKFAVALHLDLGLRVTNGIDLLSAAKGDRRSLDTIMTALGGEVTLNKGNVIALFKHEESISASVRDIALQAWTASRAGTLDHMAQRFAKVPKIDTQGFEEQHLSVLTKILRDADRLNALKPTKVKNEVSADFSHKQGKLHLTSNRFKTRVMPTTRNQTLEVVTESQGKQRSIAGRATEVKGRAATISLNDTFRGGNIRSVTTIGREDPTSAEGQRAKIILFTLQRSIATFKQPFVQAIWLPTEKLSWLNQTPHPRRPVPLYFPSRDLNASQQQAVKAILSNSDADRITVIQGPPGTGKTTVIAASVTSFMKPADKSRTVWLVAQSNVAVKNVAEKLATVGFLNFKLLVSREFHFDWHEHLYETISRNVIRSDDFSDDAVGVERLLLGSRVILCTLSMLSNNRLSIFARLVPVETVIVDEASQIEIGDYLPMLFRFQPSLRKLVFIGDDKQLAPFGQDDLGDLQSIFEMPHLQERAVFLDTQYRMPAPIGDFISKQVYGGRLKTDHAPTPSPSCLFIDVHKGKEARKGFSWVNHKEVQVSISIARKYHGQGKSYRIVTPYDAQRSMLENELKSAKLPWEDKCFNVDSFQGNEDDHIIISLVRSEKIGFLREIRRVNVMLTRCKKSMVVCTTRAFLEGVASSSLVGGLAVALGEQGWVDSRKVQNIF